MTGGRVALAVALTSGARADIPVDPDADTAREWAREELADPIYHQGESLLQRAIDWVMERLEEAQGALAGLDFRVATVVLLAAIVIGALIVLAVVGPVRRARRERESTEVFVADARTAAELRASADALAADGRWDEAVLDRFRAILRSLEERVVLAERPGWTADEASAEAAVAFPASADDLRRASRLFDDVCYGDLHAGPQDEAWLRTLDRTLTDTRPVTPAVQADPTESSEPSGPSGATDPSQQTRPAVVA